MIREFVGRRPPLPRTPVYLSERIAARLHDLVDRTYGPYRVQVDGQVVEDYQSPHACLLDGIEAIILEEFTRVRDGIYALTPDDHSGKVSSEDAYEVHDVMTALWGDGEGPPDEKPSQVDKIIDCLDEIDSRLAYLIEQGPFAERTA